MTLHDRFTEALKGSHPSTLAVSRYLRRRGVQHQVNALQVAPSFDTEHEFGDLGDITLEDGRTVEVKQTSYPFAGRLTWPFKDFIVEPVAKFERKRVRPHAYFVVNRPCSVAGVVLVEATFAQWTIENRMCRSLGERIPLDLYIAPLDVIRWTLLPPT